MLWVLVCNAVGAVIAGATLLLGERIRRYFSEDRVTSGGLDKREHAPEARKNLHLE